MDHGRAVLFALGASACLLACTETDTGSPASTGPGGWTPGTVLPSLTAPLRGLLDLRGVIHSHTVYSHDACDGAPRDEHTDAINLPCLADFRHGLCTAQHQFIMLTDHGDSFARSEFPDVLLYDASLGDELVERGGTPVANWLSCPDGAPPALVMAGNESAMEPVGLEGHVAADEAGRDAVYGSASTASVAALRAGGAVVLLQHTENWSVDQIIDLGVGGFEMYNLHANTIMGAGGVFSLLSKIQTPEELPQSDLVLLPIINEDARYLDTWSTVLTRGAERVTTIATDCHQNTFQQELPDGERVDSYRRMMQWMSNHLLVEPSADGSWDDAALKAALRARRLYGVFEVMGYPEGFDYHAEAGGQIYEMGAELPVSGGVELVVTPPTVRDLDPSLPAPEITVRLLRASEGGWQEVASAQGPLDETVSEPGAYRAEVRMKPLHLRRWLSSYADLAEQDFPWIYANAIYLVP